MKTRTLSIAIPVISGLVAAAAAMAQPVQLVTPAPVQYGQSTVVIAPNAPPPPRVETIPQPPSAEAKVMFWQPGHWMWNGANWEWASTSRGRRRRRSGSRATGRSSRRAAMSGWTDTGRVDEGGGQCLASMTSA